VTAPTSRQLNLALGLIRPEWGATAWPILGQIAAHTIDYWGRDAAVEIGELTLARRTGLAKNTVSRRVEQLIGQRVLELFPSAGRQARTLRIEGDFTRWEVPWRIDRSKVLFVLADAVVAHPIGEPQRWVCGSPIVEPQSSDEPEPDLPVYRIVGDFVPHPRLTHKRRVVGQRMSAPQPGAPLLNVGSSSNYCFEEEEQRISVEVTDGARAVLGAIYDVTGIDLWGAPKAEVCAAVTGLADTGPIAGALRRHRPPRWREAVALAVRTAAAVRAAREEELAAAAERERVQAEREASPGPADNAARMRELRRRLSTGQTDGQEVVAG
jgi:hypothetical protein